MTITEVQWNEIAQRLNAIAVRGPDCEHVLRINMVLQAILQAERAQAQNVVPMAPAQAAG